MFIVIYRYNGRIFTSSHPTFSKALIDFYRLQERNMEPSFHFEDQKSMEDAARMGAEKTIAAPRN